MTCEHRTLTSHIAVTSCLLSLNQNNIAPTGGIYFHSRKSDIVIKLLYFSEAPAVRTWFCYRVHYERVKTE
jgi:hypothetical protein